jgi:hypothetical protein
MTTMAEPCDKCGLLDANKCLECNPCAATKAAKLTEQIKALVREKPTAINAYGLKSWEKIEQMITDALAQSVVPEDRKYSQREMEHYANAFANARDRRRVTENDREAAEEAWSRRVGSCNTKQTCMEKVKEDFMAGFTRGLIQARSAQEAK